MSDFLARFTVHTLGILKGKVFISRVEHSALVVRHAADTCIQTHGGYGFTEEFDIERKFRETRLYQVAPISTNLILSHVATHVLKMPKSF